LKHDSGERTGVWGSVYLQVHNPVFPTQITLQHARTMVDPMEHDDHLYAAENQVCCAMLPKTWNSPLPLSPEQGKRGRRGGRRICLPP